MLSEHITLKDLDVYNLSRESSRKAWEIYKGTNWRVQKIVGDQFITSIDSIGANIAEGQGRYHYLDRIKFYYNARGSLLEAIHWLELLNERGIIKNDTYQETKELLLRTHKVLNGFISSTYKSKSKD